MLPGRTVSSRKEEKTELSLLEQKEKTELSPLEQKRTMTQHALVLSQQKEGNKTESVHRCNRDCWTSSLIREL